MIIPDAWRAGLAVLALRMASRRCFLTAIAVLALAILLVAMTAAGGPAQAVADALLIDTDTNVAFGSVPGAVSGAMDVGTTPALEKREGGGLKARGAGGKAKRPVDVTLTAGGEPTDVGRREEEPALEDVIDATSAAEAAAHRSEGGAGEGRAKRVRKERGFVY